MARPKILAPITPVTVLLMTAGILNACAPSQNGPLQEGSFSGRFDGNTSIATRADAIAMVIRAHPELRGFGSRSLPPSAIETAPVPDGGWHVSFVQRGSGRPGILNARCFLVDGLGRVASVGTLSVELSRQVDRIDQTNCRGK